MCTSGVEFPFWFDPRGVCSFFIYIRYDILEYLKRTMSFLVGNLLGLAKRCVSRAGVLHHPARTSPLQIFLGNVSAFAVCGLFHQLLICLKFYHQAIKHHVGS